jgi:hypothetical protein
VLHCPTSLKIHPLSSLCFTVPLAQKYIFSSFLCLTDPPTKNTSTLPKGASLSHQPQIHSLSFMWLTVPLAKSISSLLFVSHCPTSQKFIHPPFCASLSHQPKIHPLSFLCLTSRVSAVASDRVSSETSNSIVSVIQFELIQFLLLVRCPLKDVCLAGLIRLNETRQLIEGNSRIATPTKTSPLTTPTTTLEPPRLNRDQ